MQKRNRLLLHICCAPCSSAAIRALKEEYDITLFFYNPNIYPKEEYDLRLEEARKVSSAEGMMLIEGEYDHEAWREIAEKWAAVPEGGIRCRWCYEFRLRKTAIYAKGHGFDTFATTLTLSPHKDCATINEIGQKAGEENNVNYLDSNFKKKDGYNYSIRYSKEHGLHRQDYCGCEYSKNGRQISAEDKGT
jgi:hypothetical protein